MNEKGRKRCVIINILYSKILVYHSLTYQNFQIMFSLKSKSFSKIVRQLRNTGRPNLTTITGAKFSLLSDAVVKQCYMTASLNNGNPSRIWHGKMGNFFLKNLHITFHNFLMDVIVSKSIRVSVVRSCPSNKLLYMYITKLPESVFNT